MDQLRLFIRKENQDIISIIEHASLISIALFDPTLKLNFNVWFNRYFSTSKIETQKTPISYGIIFIDFITNTIYSCQDYQEMKRLSFSDLQFTFSIPKKNEDNYKLDFSYIQDYLFPQTGYKKQKKIFYYFTKEYFDITNISRSQFLDLSKEIFLEGKTSNKILESLFNNRLYIGNFYLCFRHDFKIKEFCCESNNLLKLFITFKNIGLFFDDEEKNNWKNYIKNISDFSGYAYSQSLYDKLIFKSGLN